MVHVQRVWPGGERRTGVGGERTRACRNRFSNRAGTIAPPGRPGNIENERSKFIPLEGDNVTTRLTGPDLQQSSPPRLSLFVFPASRAADGKVQLPDPDSWGSNRGRSGRRGLGPAHSASAAPDQTRSLSAVHSRRTTPTPGGDGTQTQQVPCLLLIAHAALATAIEVMLEVIQSKHGVYTTC